ncbi:MAG: Stp1/IreP family PP2C-type Ser/Thr phosphatase [Christensenellaceae bacterium]|nr:Stp1/IreP family PP2C-type Ser/Thr phosphatase [Christensenellaceae bacterium]
MSHKFRFSKESRARMKSFAIGEESPAKEPAEELREAEEPEEQLPDLPLIVETRTDVGRVRASNQDTLIEGERLWGVADGMGGHNGGETASKGARDALIEALRDLEPSPEALRAGIEEANARLFQQQKEDASLAGMGTTLTALWLSDHFVYIGHVGDSRAYLVRDGRMRQMTSDHSLVAELFRMGQLTREQAANHPMRNVITRAVGTEAGIEADLIVEERRKGDLWLVCSDGLYGMVEDDRIEAALTAHTPAKAADLLMDMALKAGGRDNVSLVVLLDREGGQ